MTRSRAWLLVALVVLFGVVVYLLVDVAYDVAAELREAF